MSTTTVPSTPPFQAMTAFRKFSVAEICRVFGVPPPLVQDYSHNTFTNSQEASRWFASNTLQPWVRKVEAEFRRSVFGPGQTHLMLDLGELMRGSPLERWQGAEIAARSGILEIDEIRSDMGWPPRGAQPQPEVAA